MADPKTLFILAGEASGDRIAADLVRRLRQRTALNLIGVGGDELIGEGLTSLYPMADLAVMGLSDVLKRLPRLLWRMEQTARAILKAQPDVVVLVDAQEFSALLAKRLRRGGFAKPVLLYVAPSVWARRPERAGRLKPLFDEVLAVLPFEPEVMVRLGGPRTAYVGHPALMEMQAPAERPSRIALLPGSRGGELRRHLPLLRQVAEALAPEAPGGLFLPTLKALAPALAAETAGWPVDVTIVADRAERLALYHETKLAVVCAGTATLELALASVPMAVFYAMDRTQARHFEDLGAPRVGLPNIILDDDVTPEIISGLVAPQQVLDAVRALLRDPAAQARQREGFDRLKTLMRNGTADHKREDPADRVLAYLQKPAL